MADLSDEPSTRQPAVFESVTWSAPCQECGAELECHGVQALVAGSLRWDVESACPACGFALAVCAGALPVERREQLLAEHGPAKLSVSDPQAQRVLIMRVLRAEAGLDLPAAKAEVRRVVSGAYSGTFAEMEHLAGRLRACGVGAVAARG
ncbi:hypothetical protein BN159_1051 [Streptomyces davaonensis JCM 4913]|uniref:Ribosomal protein L7/L12 C-terminal domain-containing protein n=1 Tax=Streptomyces davaonensis (strain DSM 101723 / JCM 4913 / KCC S-0913 / 768) TaxID=1214101 RepID=K4QX79_STRDJ|nr:hypothetical protein [Streptomyces davaonensis]CCK25430.1 hypothetical protein BN159_1051 [Streptomyces davaonensis JCM 4913]